MVALIVTHTHTHTQDCDVQSCYLHSTMGQTSAPKNSLMSDYAVAVGFPVEGVQATVDAFQKVSEGTEHAFLHVCSYIPWHSPK